MMVVSGGLGGPRRETGAGRGRPGGAGQGDQEERDEGEEGGERRLRRRPRPRHRGVGRALSPGENRHPNPAHPEELKVLRGDAPVAGPREGKGRAGALVSHPGGYGGKHQLLIQINFQ